MSQSGGIVDRFYWWIVAASAVPAIVVSLTVRPPWWGVGLLAAWNGLRIFWLEPRHHRTQSGRTL